jgi:hypothetical protein
LDLDETFDLSVQRDLAEFWESNKKIMMFDYKSPMPTIDERRVLGGETYPKLAHCKAFKYDKKLCFKPYQGLAIPTGYSQSDSDMFKAYSKINHYCFYTREMEKQKKDWIIKEFGEKVYTNEIN